MEIIDRMDDTSPETETPEKRALGRPKGLPRTGGRPRGAKGKLPEEFRRFIDQRGRPLEFLAAISRGNMVTAADPADPTKKTRVYPTLRERTLAAQALLDRLLPALKATEMSGPGGGPLEVVPVSDFDRARWVAFELAKAAMDEPSPEIRAAAAAAAELALGASSRPPELTARSQVLDAKPAPILAPVEAEVVEEPAAPQLLPVGHTNDCRNFTMTLVERLPDGRERWTARSTDGALLGTGFDAARLYEHVREGLAIVRPDQIPARRSGTPVVTMRRPRNEQRS